MSREALTILGAMDLHQEADSVGSQSKIARLLHSVGFITYGMTVDSKGFFLQMLSVQAACRSNIIW